MNHRLPASLLLFCSSCAVLAAPAAGVAADPGAQQAPAAQSAATPNDEDFLAFLGDWEDDQGNWHDPLEYDDPQWSRLDKPQEQKHE